MKHVFLILIMLCMLIRGSWAQSTFHVTNTSTANVNGSFLNALNLANASPGQDVILFDVGGTFNSPEGPSWIIGSSLIIDGNGRNVTLSGIVINNNVRDVIVRGVTVTQPGHSSLPGIFFRTGARNCQVENCIVIGNNGGIQINRVDSISIRGCYIGVHPSAPRLNSHANNDGIIVNRSTRVYIGAPGAANRNYISGNNWKGIWVRGTSAIGHNNPNVNSGSLDPLFLSTTGNRSSHVNIVNNYIGLAPDGQTALGNRDGVFSDGSSPILVEDNYISGNTSVGLNFDNGNNELTVRRNFIGVSVAPHIAVPNNYGIVLRNSQTDFVTVGGSPDNGNVISGNTSVGIEVRSFVNPILPVGFDFTNIPSLAVCMSAASMLSELADPDAPVVPRLTRNVTISYNNIGIGSGPDNVLPNDTAIHIRSGSSGVYMHHNNIYGNDYRGVVVNNGWDNMISENTIARNGVPGISLVNNGNYLKDSPSILDFKEVVVKGVSEPGDRVELFRSDENLQEKNAYDFLGTVVADENGFWQLKVNRDPSTQYLVATATNVAGNTSEFSNVFRIPCRLEVKVDFVVRPPLCGECNGSIEAQVQEQALSSSGYTYEWRTCCEFCFHEGPDNSTLLTGNTNVLDNRCPGCYMLRVRDPQSGCIQDKQVFLEVEDELECNGCLAGFAPTKHKKYVISAWVKEEGVPRSISDYRSPRITLNFEGTNFPSSSFSASGPVIDGWQRIEEEFVIPEYTTDLTIQLENTGTTAVYFDDVRVFPMEGGMVTYVYDPVTMRLVAQQDDNNFSTFYEYDEAGNLVRVKKETERGILTIKESRQNLIKKVTNR